MAILGEQFSYNQWFNSQKFHFLLHNVMLGIREFLQPATEVNKAWTRKAKTLSLREQGLLTSIGGACEVIFVFGDPN